MMKEKPNNTKRIGHGRRKMSMGLEHLTPRKQVHLLPVICFWIVNFFMAGTASANFVEELTLLRQEDFEGSSITWDDGGSDAILVESEGEGSSKAMRLRDNTGSSTTTLKTALTEAPSYDKIRVKFWFRAIRFRNGEDFWLQSSYDDGDTWNNEAVWIKGTNFENDVQYNAEAEFSPTPEEAKFPLTLKLRFRCDASSNTDQVFLDNIQVFGVKIVAVTNSPTIIPSQYPSMSPSTSPTSLPSSVSPSRSLAPSVPPSFSYVPSQQPSPEPEPKTREEICPIDRQWSLPSKYYILGDETKFSEISGLAFSQQTYMGHRIAYVVGDKGSNSEQYALQAVYFRYDSTTNNFIGELLASLKLDISYDGTEVPDWENMSMGPCDDAGLTETCIYVGNTGNNAAHDCNSKSCTEGQERVKIYKFKEINWSSTPVVGMVPGGEITIANVATMLLEYSSDFPAARNDAEAMFVDFTGDNVSGDRKGDIYLFTKNPNDKTQRRIGKVSLSNHADLTYGTTSNVITIEMVGRTYENYIFTGGDMSPDGRLIVLRTGVDVFYFPRVMGTSVATSLDFDAAATPCNWIAPTSRKLANENKYESVAFVSSSTVAELSECDGGSTCDAPVYFYDLIFPSTVIPTLPDTPVGSTVTALTNDEFHSSSWSDSNWMLHPDNSDSSKPVLLDNIADVGKCSASYKARISDNDGIDSSFYHKSSYDCIEFDRIVVSFDFFTNDSYEKLDDFFLEYSYDNGDHWMIVEDWTRGSGTFMNEEECYSTKVHIEKHVGDDFTSLSNAMKLRFRSNANSSTDGVYLMNILVEGVTFKSTT